MLFLTIRFIFFLLNQNIFGVSNKYPFLSNLKFNFACKIKKLSHFLWNTYSSKFIYFLLNTYIAHNLIPIFHICLLIGQYNFEFSISSNVSYVKTKNDIGDYVMARIIDSEKKNLIGGNLKKLRAKLKISQQTLSNKLELLGVYICRGSISRIEDRSRTVTDIELFAIAEVLGVDIKELYLN